MDGSRFDSLARSLADRPSRRRVLGAMLGAVAAGLAGAAGRGVDAAPRCKRVDQACQTTADCCPGPNANGDVQCASNGKKSKTCQACAAGTHACNGTCIAFTTNTNCGSCGTSCQGGSSCVSGVCTCPSGQTLCNGACVATTTDNDNCGGCGTICTGGSSCVNGACRCGAFQHRDAAGTCTCVDTSCPHPEFGDDVREFCCPDFVCDPDTDQCRACSPRYGTCGYTLPGGFGQDPALCCGDQQCLNGVCYTKCADDADCDTAGGEFCCDRFAVCLTDATACN